jgi:pimeloyl-ACP methyl ester carboxylesterase
MRVVFVHGACVKDGSWWWHRTAELLAERDVASEAPALPSCGETGEQIDAQGPGLVEDVAAVRELLTAGDEPTVVVAHSYGGIVTAEAAAGVDAVRHLLLVSSYLPEDMPTYAANGEGETTTSYVQGAHGLIEQRSGGTTSYPLRDAHGDVTAIGDEAGEVTSRQSYDPWGTQLSGPSIERGYLGGPAAAFHPTSGLIQLAPSSCSSTGYEPQR